MKKVLTLGLALLMMAGLSYAAPKKIRIEMVSKGYQHEFWKTVEKGAQVAAAEFGAEVVFIGPEAETETAKQVSMVENAINKKVDAIALAPLDGTALLPVAKKAVKAKIPLLTFDSFLADSKTSLSFIATDNVAAGKVAAVQLAKLMGEKGKVAIVNHLAGAGSAIDREKGFRDGMKAYPNIKILNTQYSGGDKSKALNITQDLLQANPDLKGIFASCEGNGVGVARAVEEKKMQDKVAVVGFDSSEDEIALLKSGALKGMMVQNPYNMGYLSVKNLVAVINKKKIPARIDTGATYVSMDNFEDDEIQALLYPLGK
jgi:ribose transport system substrate-binding protein